uniref:Uncharacterized protein n=1 Tax=Rhizobium rhizogenes TaxID=359 RepID=A0A7S4ZTV5_RHIRH|nr:hypothetical protein pC5.8b_485 [Rhizobium rhizogenes]
MISSDERARGKIEAEPFGGSVKKIWLPSKMSALRNARTTNFALPKKMEV